MRVRVDVYVCECPPLNLESFIINKCSIVNVEMINQEKRKNLNPYFGVGFGFFNDILAL